MPLANQYVTFVIRINTSNHCLNRNLVLPFILHTTVRLRRLPVWNSTCKALTLQSSHGNIDDVQSERCDIQEAIGCTSE